MGVGFGLGGDKLNAFVLEQVLGPVPEWCPEGALTIYFHEGEPVRYRRWEYRLRPTFDTWCVVGDPAIPGRGRPWKGLKTSRRENISANLSVYRQHLPPTLQWWERPSFTSNTLLPVNLHRN